MCVNRSPSHLAVVGTVADGEHDVEIVAHGIGPVDVARKAKAPYLTPGIHFATHTMVSSAVFVIVALPAVGFFLLVELAGHVGLSGFVIYVFRSLEYCILSVDALVFIGFLGINAWNFIKEIAQ